MTNEATSSEDPCKNIDLVRVVAWITRTWRELQKRTISKCFSNCGFTQEGVIIHPQPPQLPVRSPNEEELIRCEKRDIFPPSPTAESLFDKIASDIDKEEYIEDDMVDEDNIELPVS